MKKGISGIDRARRALSGTSVGLLESEGEGEGVGVGVGGEKGDYIKD